jgi:integrase
VRLGNWLTSEQAQKLWQAPCNDGIKHVRDRALLALLLSCGLRRHELVQLELDSLQEREDHCAIVDLKGKAGHIRTVPIPSWVKNLLDDWLIAASISEGRIFRRVNKAGKISECAISEKAVWHVVRRYAANIGLGKLAPHDLRRTCARWFVFGSKRGRARIESVPIHRRR